VNFEETGAMLGRKIGHEPAPDEVLSFLMYPDVFLKFAKARQSYGDVEVLPTPQFYYGMQKGDEIAVELEPGKALVIKFLTVGEPHPEGFRTVFFELNGQPREVNIRDKSLEVKVAAAPKADPAQPGEIGAPIPGVVSTVAVELNQSVKKGDRLLVMEAMKMQSTVYAPVGGKVTQVLVQPGRHVEAKDLLLVIE
jgi:pyruvate carboxylase